MKTGIKSLHDNASIIRESLKSAVSSPEVFDDKCQPVIDYIEELEGKIRILQKQVFSSKTEKRPAPENDPQMLLFNEAETESPEEQAPEEVKEETIEVPAHKRVKPKRKPLPESLERVEVVHDIAESEKVCGCGTCLEKIGEETSEKLDIIPAKIRVIRHIRPKYACKKCEGTESEGPTVKIAPVPDQIIPKGIPSAGLLAWIVVSKFCDSLPLYRQVKLFERIGVTISISTMASWMIQVAEKCGPMIDLLRMEILSGPCINIDETTLQVLKEQDRADETKSYMWVFRGGPPEKPSVIFQYSRTRSGSVAKDFVEGYKGYCQTDGYAGYDCLEKDSEIKLLGCFSHARRKFIDVIDARGKKDKGKTGSAEQALGYIQKLYRIERSAADRKLSPYEIFELRQNEAKPVLDEFKSWMDKRVVQVPPSSLLGKALKYTLSNWERLIRYIKDGNLKPDNNAAENAIRPFVVGRKNWLFAGHPNGAHASSVLYSLVESAKSAGLEPYAYLRFLFEKIPLAQTEDDYQKLLPQSITTEYLSVFISKL